MDIEAAKTVARQVSVDLNEAADDILELSTTLAENNREFNAFKDEMAAYEAEARVDASQINPQTGKPYYPNVDAQAAAVLLTLNKSEKYRVRRNAMRDLTMQIEIRKAKLLRLHEQRRDIKTETDIILGLTTL
jgi:hypothetical protein